MFENNFHFFANLVLIENLYITDWRFTNTGLFKIFAQKVILRNIFLLNEEFQNSTFLKIWALNKTDGLEILVENFSLNLVFCD